jgi:TM2 domain-containing membrane protein YozV
VQTVRGAAATASAAPTRTAVAAAAGEKNPGLALVLSLLIVGLGQFYNGDWKKGLAMLGGTLILGPLTAGVAWLGFAIWSMIDAYGVAKGTTKRW